MTRIVALVGLIILAIPSFVQAQETVGKKKLYIGADMVDVGDFASAIPYLEEALEEEPDLCRAHFYLSKAYLGLGTAEGIERARREAMAYQDCESVEMIRDVEEILGEIEGAVPTVATVATPDGGEERRDIEGETDGDGGGEAPSPTEVAEQTVATRNATADLRFKQRKQVGTVMLVTGGAAAVGGFVGNVAVALYGYENQEDDQLYEAARKSSNALLGVGIAGAGVGVTGLLLVLIPEQKFNQARIIPGPVTTVCIRF